MVIAYQQEVDLVSRSRYLEYVPSIYSEGDFMGRFLMIFERVLDPIEGVLDNIASYLDPATAPPELLSWLASWVNLVLDDSWSLERRRQLVKSAVELYQWRGTHRGLREYLRVYTGIVPSIKEDYGSITLDNSTRLGWNFILGGGRPYTFDVILELEDLSTVDEERVRSIIESQKPAHAGYTLQIINKASADQLEGT